MDYQSLLNKLLSTEFHSESMKMWDTALPDYALQGFYSAMEEGMSIETYLTDDDGAPIYTADEALALFAYLQKTLEGG